MVWDSVYMKGSCLLIQRCEDCYMCKLVPSEICVFGVCERQGCVMSPCLFNIYVNSYMREMKAKVGDLVTAERRRYGAAFGGRVISRQYCVVRRK